MPVTHAFTSKARGLANVLIQVIKITLPNDPGSVFNTNGIWDTGASASVISQNVIKKLGLKPTGSAIVNTASEKGHKSPTYLVDIFLKDDVRIRGVVVTVGELMEGFECLIGMDVITLGDFAVTNFEGQTCVSFRVPSLRQIDFVQELKPYKPFVADKKPGRNDPCYCGSGKKYKNCHGKKKSLFSR